MHALHIHAGPKALAHIRDHGLRPEHIGIVPGAAGGPKGLILGPLDRFIFGEWLAQSSQPVHLVGASIGAWRMATACLNDPVAAFDDRIGSQFGCYQVIEAFHEPGAGERLRDDTGQVAELRDRAARLRLAGTIAHRADARRRAGVTA